MCIGVGAAGLAPALAEGPNSASVTGASQTYLKTGGTSGGFFLLGPVPSTPPNVLESLTDQGADPLKNPGGNTEVGTESNFLANVRSTMTTTFADGSKAIFSSVTAADFFGAGNTSTTYGVNNLANQYFDQILDGNIDAGNLPGFEAALLASGRTRADLFNAFQAGGGFELAGDPNIAFVEKEGDKIRFGLAGFFDLLDVPVYKNALVSAAGPLANLIPNNWKFQASEVAKVNVLDADGNEVFSGFKWSPNAEEGLIVEKSDVISNDSTDSFDATYDPGTITVPGKPPTDVPEPTALLGLAALGGLALKTRKRQLV